jgi:hypothetical protein
MEMVGRVGDDGGRRRRRRRRRAWQAAVYDFDTF